MRFIGGVIEKLQRHPKRIVFPEGIEPRVLQAARQFYSLRLGAPILLGDRTKIKEAAMQLSVSLQGIRIINPAESEELEGFTRRYELLRRSQGLQANEAREAMKQPNYFGAMMVAMHQADGFVSGTKDYACGILRPLFQVLKARVADQAVCGCMIMDLGDASFGEEGVVFMADCNVIPEPTADQLAQIAVSTAALARQLLGTRPRVALLSYSTGGAAEGNSIERVRAATGLARDLAAARGLAADFEGEMQVDAALVPAIAQRKLETSRVAGKATVLIFPDLNSGNIGSKLIQHVVKANAYGQILLGLNRPAAEVSRGSSAHDTLGVAAIVGLQAIDYHKLYPDADDLLPGDPHSHPG